MREFENGNNLDQVIEKIAIEAASAKKGKKIKKSKKVKKWILALDLTSHRKFFHIMQMRKLGTRNLRHF